MHRTLIKESLNGGIAEVHDLGEAANLLEARVGIDTLDAVLLFAGLAAVGLERRGAGLRGRRAGRRGGRGRRLGLREGLAAGRRDEDVRVLDTSNGIVYGQDRPDRTAKRQ